MSLLKKVGKWNDIPKELEPALPDAGTVVVFEFQNFYIDPGTKSRRWPEHCTVAAQSEFLNPENGESIPIALIKSSDKEGNEITCHKVVASPQNYGGCYLLTIGTAESNSIYRFLMLSSQNGSNPNRVANVDVLFTVQDLKAAAIEKSGVRKKRREATVFIENMKDEQLQQIAMVLDLSTSDDIDVVRDAIEDYAEKDPVKFLEAVKSGDADIIAVYKRARKHQVLYRDKASIRWTDTNGEAVPLTQESDAVAVEEFVNFVKTRPQGKAIIEMAREKTLQAEAKIAKKKTGKKTEAATEE